MKQRAALYVRVSTEEQAKHGLSLQEQLNSLREYAEKNGMEVVGVYSDAGISARKPYTKRPDLLRLLSDCEAHKVDIILFIKLDRWFRNVGNYYAVQDILDKCGVSWQATKEDYETRTASGRLKVNIMLSVAQDEADRTSERIRFITDAKKAKGQSPNAKAPLGLKVVDSHYVIDPDTADIARDMFAQYIALQSALGLSKYMRQRYGITRTYNNYMRYLRNRLYIGEAYGIENALPALISRKDFDLVGDILARRSTRNASAGENHTYLFSGLLLCRECGKTMQAETIARGQNRKTHTYIYYRCRTKMFKGTCSHVHRVKEDALEDYLLREIVHLIEAYRFRAEKRAKKEKAPAVTPESIRRKMQKLKDLYLMDMIEIEDYKADYSALKEQLESLEMVQKMSPPPTPISEIECQLAEYPDMSRTQKKAFWARTVKRIEADDNGAFFVTPV